MAITQSEPMMVQEDLTELFRLMDVHGMGKEKEQVMDMARYLDSMEAQFGAVLAELQAVRSQLEQIQDRGLRATAEKVIGKVDEKVTAAGDQIKAVKDQFIKGARQAVTDIKSKGAVALNRTLTALGLPRGLTFVRARLRSAALAADHGISRLTTMGDELHEAKNHMRNVGSVLAGKEPVKRTSRDEEKGMIYHMQKGLYHGMVALEGMEKRTEKALDRLVGSGEISKSEGKTSVVEDLKSIQAETHMDNKEPVKINNLER